MTTTDVRHQSSWSCWGKAASKDDLGLLRVRAAAPADAGACAASRPSAAGAADRRGRLRVVTRVGCPGDALIMELM